MTTKKRPSMILRFHEAREIIATLKRLAAVEEALGHVEDAEAYKRMADDYTTRLYGKDKSE